MKTLRATLAPGAIMAWSGAVTCAALLVIALISGEELIAETAYGWGILLGLALFAHACGQGLIAHALAHLPIAFSSVALIVETLSAAALGWLILHEPLGTLPGRGRRAGARRHRARLARQPRTTDRLGSYVCLSTQSGSQTAGSGHHRQNVRFKQFGATCVRLIATPPSALDELLNELEGPGVAIEQPFHKLLGRVAPHKGGRVARKINGVSR